MDRRLFVLAVISLMSLTGMGTNTVVKGNVQFFDGAVWTQGTASTPLALDKNVNLTVDIGKSRPGTLTVKGQCMNGSANLKLLTVARVKVHSGLCSTPGNCYVYQTLDEQIISCGGAPLRFEEHVPLWCDGGRSMKTVQGKMGDTEQDAAGIGVRDALGQQWIPFPGGSVMSCAKGI